MISQKAKLHNRFDFEIYDTETGETEYAQAENIVLNNMWSRLCAGLYPFSYIGVGTGSGTLSPARTTLFNHLAYKSSVGVEIVYDTDNTAHVTESVTFSEAEAIGAWTEVGILYGTNTSSNYVTHALITDSEGNPITVNKTNTKIVTVYATIFAEVLTPAAGNYNAPGDKNTLLASLVGTTFPPDAYVTTLKKIDGSPALLGIVGTVDMSWSADAANKRRYSNLARFGTTAANAKIRGIILGEESAPQKQAGATSVPNSVFEKKDFAGVAIGTGDASTQGFDFPLSFAKPGSETVYINGVAKTRGADYTVRYGMRSADTMIVDTPNATRVIIGPNQTLDEIVELPQPTGEECNVTSIVIKNGTASTARMISYDIKLSTDGTTWVDAGASASFATSATITLNGFTPAAYKYMRAILVSSSATGNLSLLQVYATPPATKHIEFTTPPGNGAVITADFSTEYIPKSENFVLDIQGEIIYGEGA